MVGQDIKNKNLDESTPSFCAEGTQYNFLAISRLARIIKNNKNEKKILIMQ